MGMNTTMAISISFKICCRVCIKNLSRSKRGFSPWMKAHACFARRLDTFLQHLDGHALLCQIGMTILEVTYARPVCTNVVPLQVMQFARCHQLAQHLMSKLEQSIEWI